MAAKAKNISLFIKSNVYKFFAKIRFFAVPAYFLRTKHLQKGRFFFFL